MKNVENHDIKGNNKNIIKFHKNKFKNILAFILMFSHKWDYNLIYKYHDNLNFMFYTQMKHLYNNNFSILLTIFIMLVIYYCFKLRIKLRILKNYNVLYFKMSSILIWWL